MLDEVWQGYSRRFKLLFRVLGEESLAALRAPCQNFFCSHRFRRACQNPALPRETHRAGKKPCCASWPRGLVAAVTVLRPRTKPQTPTGFPSNGGGSLGPWSLFWCSVASLPLVLRRSIALIYMYDKEYKIYANYQTGGSVCAPHLIAQACLRIISPHHHDACGTYPA